MHSALESVTLCDDGRAVGPHGGGWNREVSGLPASSATLRARRARERAAAAVAEDPSRDVEDVRLGVDLSGPAAAVPPVDLGAAVLRAQRRFTECSDVTALAEELVAEVHDAGYARVLLLETVARSRHRELEVIAAEGDLLLVPGSRLAGADLTRMCPSAVVELVPGHPRAPRLAVWGGGEGVGGARFPRLEVLTASAGAAWRALVATADAARADRESAGARLLLSGALRLAGLGSWSWNPASGVVTLDDRLREMLGLPAAEPDPDLETWRSRIHPDDRGPFTGVEDPAAHAGTSAPYPFRVASADGTERTFLGMSVPLSTTSTSVVQGLVLDVSAGEKSTGELVRLAQCDSLTGLANRSVLDVRLAEALERATPQDAVALVLLDLDRFKLVNDTLGHQIGDALLRQVAVRLEDAAPPGAVLARLGGDEFVVMVPGVSRVEAASIMARDVLRRLRTPMLLPGLPEPFVCTSSAGIAIGHDGTADDLFRSADMALYRAKDGGRDRVAVYDSAMREEAQARHVAEHRVRRALRTDGLRVVWQPIVDLRSSELVAAEALVRLDDPVEGSWNPSTSSTPPRTPGSSSTSTRGSWARSCGNCASGGATASACRSPSTSPARRSSTPRSRTASRTASSRPVPPAVPCSPRSPNARSSTCRRRRARAWANCGASVPASVSTTSGRGTPRCPTSTSSR